MNDRETDGAKAGAQPRIDQTLCTNDRRFRAVQEVTPDGLAMFRVIRDSDGGLVDFVTTYVNLAAQRFIGKLADELLGRSLREVFPGIEGSGVWMAYVRVAETGWPEGFELGLWDQAYEVWARNQVIRLGDEIAVTFADITPQKRAEASLAVLAEASSALAGSLVQDEVIQRLARVVVGRMADWCSIYLCNADGSVRQAAVADVDPEHERVLQDLFKSGFDPDGPSGPARVIRTGLPEFLPEINDGEPLTQILDPDLVSKMRSLSCLSHMTVPIMAGRRTVGAIGFGSRTDGRRFSQADLALAEEIGRRTGTALDNMLLYQEAQAASRLKDEFLAVVSHELRTPLSAITGWATLLKSAQQGDPALLAKGLDVIERNAKSQRKIIDDILDVSRIVAGKLRIRPEPLSMTEVVREAIEVVKPSADARDIALHLEGGEDPCLLLGDPERMQQVLWNLLTNAVKFTPRGGEVRARLRRERGTVAVVVSDTGRGIEPEFLPFAFERFRQEDSSSSRSHGGLGLGLSIVRHLVEMHGGRVSAESEGIGKGSTFTIRLPVNAVAQPCRSDRPPASCSSPLSSEVAPNGHLGGLRVLVVDDEEDARDLLLTVLSRHGAVVMAAASTLDAMKALSDFRPDVLLSDIGMPEENGFALLSRVRREKPGLPAVALTAYARSEDVEEARIAGFNVHLAKPVDANDLVNVLRTIRA